MENSRSRPPRREIAPGLGTKNESGNDENTYKTLRFWTFLVILMAYLQKPEKAYELQNLPDPGIPFSILFHFFILGTGVAIYFYFISFSIFKKWNSESGFWSSNFFGGPPW